MTTNALQRPYMPGLSAESIKRDKLNTLIGNKMRSANVNKVFDDANELVALLSKTFRGTVYYSGKEIRQMQHAEKKGLTFPCL